MNFSVCTKYDTAKEILTHPNEPWKCSILDIQKPKSTSKYCIFVKEKPKPNTLVFDLGFDWRKEWDSLRDIISLNLLPLDSSYSSLILIISLSLSRARKFICIVKIKTGYSRFPQAGVLRLDFRLRSNANDGNKLPRTSSRHFFGGALVT